MSSPPVNKKNANTQSKTTPKVETTAKKLAFDDSSTNVIEKNFKIEYPVGAEGLVYVKITGTKKWHPFIIEAYNEQKNIVIFKFPNENMTLQMSLSRIQKYKIGNISMCDEAIEDFKKRKSKRNAQKVFDYCENLNAKQKDMNNVRDYIKKELQEFKSIIQLADQATQNSLGVLFGSEIDKLDLSNEEKRRSLKIEIAAHVCKMEFIKIPQEKKLDMKEDSEELENFIRKFAKDEDALFKELKDKFLDDIEFLKKRLERQQKRKGQKEKDSNKSYVHTGMSELTLLYKYSIEDSTVFSESGRNDFAAVNDAIIFMSFFLFLIIGGLIYRIVKLIQHKYAPKKRKNLNQLKKKSKCK